MKRLHGLNAVLIASQFNPSIFTEHWLIKKGVFSEEEVIGDRLMTPVCSQFMTAALRMVVVPERLQLSALRSDSESFEIEAAKEKLRRVVQSLPETPYTALGFNFVWRCSASDPHKTPGVLRQVFSNPAGGLWGNTELDDEVVGGTLVGGYIGSRMRMVLLPEEIAPGSGPEPAGGKVPGFSADFNYHFSFIDDTDPVEQVEAFLQAWSDCRAHSESIIDLVIGEGAASRRAQ